MTHILDDTCSNFLFSTLEQSRILRRYHFSTPSTFCMKNAAFHLDLLNEGITGFVIRSQGIFLRFESQIEVSIEDLNHEFKFFEKNKIQNTNQNFLDSNSPIRIELVFINLHIPS